MSVTVVPAFCLNYTAARKKLVNFFRNLSSILNIYQRASKMRLSKKGRHPVLDAGSPSVDMGRRCRIGVRYNGIETISSMPVIITGQKAFHATEYEPNKALILLF